MVVKYCSNCIGNPYTENLNMTNCPHCKTALSIKSASELDLLGCPVLPDSQSDMPLSPFETTPKTDSDSPFDDIQPAQHDYVEVMPPDNVSDPVSTVPNVIRGRVSQYSSTGKEDGNYRRFFITKIIDALVYKQRTEDVLHRFSVRVDAGTDAFGNRNYRDIPVNVHGTIAGGMQISDNCEVEVTGKYRDRDGVMMAHSVKIINNGYPTTVHFQHSASAILFTVLSIIVLAFLFYVGINFDGEFLEGITTFLKTWLLMFVIITVLYLILCFSRLGRGMSAIFGRKGFPFLGILIISFILALLVINSLNVGASIGNMIFG